MFNAEKPNLEELPSSAQLLKSTMLALVAAVVILVTVILPAEYNIDPTGIGRVLGLAEMGEIKQELQQEAEQDGANHGSVTRTNNIFEGLFSLIVSPAQAQSANEWQDEITFTLKPGDTNELKLTMNEGDIAQYNMIVEGGRVNFDLHAHGGGQSVTYEKGRGSAGSEGQIVAKFDGNHGWFWRNRDKTDVTVTLQLRGVYSAITEGH